MHPAELLGGVQSALLDRAGFAPAELEQVIGGCVTQAGEQSNNITRTAWLHAGLPRQAGGLTLDAQCGSAQQAAHLVAGLIAADAIGVGIACGVEAMSRIPLRAAVGTDIGSPRPAGWDLDLPNQYVGAERIARAAACPATDRRVRPAVAAPGPGRVGGGPLRPGGGAGQGAGPRRRRPADRRDAGGRPGRGPARDEPGRAGRARPVIEGGLHTPARPRRSPTARPRCCWPHAARARRWDCGRGRGSSRSAWSAPRRTTTSTARSQATERVLARSGMTIGDIDLFEVNEAFAAVVLSWLSVHRPDPDRVNVNGGAIAIGHPVGGTGARLLTTALHELERRDATTALITMCAGGAMATATIIERV